jgi:hypothetical protein
MLPWSATVEEVLGQFGPPLDVSAWDFRRWVTYAVGAERWAMTFDLGLLQSVLPEQRQHRRGILPDRNPGLSKTLA